MSSTSIRQTNNIQSASILSAVCRKITPTLGGVRRITGAFKAIWSDSWGTSFGIFLYACVAALLDCENVSLLGVQRMLVDERYREWVVKQVKDPSVRSFWLDEFTSYDNRFLGEVLSPVRNKVGQLLMAPPMRHVLGQVASTFDPRFMMDHGRILIANLSKGRLGEDKSNLLGAILVTQFQLAAMSRSNIPEEKRRDFYLYIDEFHNFSTDSFASILSEARKYRTLPHPSPSVRRATSTGYSQCSFRKCRVDHFFSGRRNGCNGA